MLSHHRRPCFLLPSALLLLSALQSPWYDGHDDWTIPPVVSVSWLVLLLYCRSQCQYWILWAWVVCQIYESLAAHIYTSIYFFFQSSLCLDVSQYVYKLVFQLSSILLGPYRGWSWRKILQNKIRTLTGPTEAITTTKHLSQFHTTSDLVRVSKTLAESMAFKYTLRVERHWKMNWWLQRIKTT